MRKLSVGFLCCPALICSCLILQAANLAALPITTIERARVATDGTGADRPSEDSKISDDGQFITFSSTATNLGIPFPDTNDGGTIGVPDAVYLLQEAAGPQ